MSFSRKGLLLIGAGGMGLAIGRRLTNTLRDNGHDVYTRLVDPSMDTAGDIFEVDLLGTANLIDAFLDVMPRGSSLTTAASIAVHLVTDIISKRDNVVRVQTAVRRAPEKGVRINTISAGIISIAMIRREFESGAGDSIRDMVQATPIQRAGSADEIASLAEFLSSQEASFINSADFVIDGGPRSGATFQ
ncbi:hypothetical protein EDB80DRAFT_752219 [Ilyonectria destructans]|nr:hypothetical protein EDB80DRAFT_752219 [Ilyonectria destructans]